MAEVRVRPWGDGWYSIEVVGPTKGGAYVDADGLSSVAVELDRDDVETLIQVLKSSLQEEGYSG